MELKALSQIRQDEVNMLTIERVQRAFDCVQTGRSSVSANALQRILQKAYTTEFFSNRETFLVDLALCEAERMNESGANLQR